MQLKKGQTLNGGKYTIRRVLGQGGFGITYLAVTSDNQEVAIKEFFMKDTCIRDADSMHVSIPSQGAKADVERYRQKFIKEANNLLRLRHPNIVQVFEVFEENGTNYYAMQYMEGGSLRDNVMRFGPMDLTTAKNYVIQVAEALKYMHERKHICHYDVKPGNILIDAEGQAMLIDFGLSKNYDGAGQQTSSTPVGISAGYAPIEQYRQTLQEFSPTTDIYALGATLYFLLSGKNPPEASVILEQGLNQPDEIDDNIWQVVSKAMQPIRQQRFQSMADFIKALQYDIVANDGATQMANQQGQQWTQQATPQPIPQPEAETPVPSSSEGNKNLLWAVIGLLAAVLVVGGILLSRGGGDKSFDHDADMYADTMDSLAFAAADSAVAVEEMMAVDTMLVDSAAAYIDDTYDEVAEENPIDVTTHMDWSGAFIIKGKPYPVRLSFYERYDYILNSEADYTNVNAGTHLTLRAERNGANYIFQGSDGRYPLIIAVRETRSGHYEGSVEGQFSGQVVFDKR